MVHRKTVARLVDQETITMGDYTVEIKPAGGEEVSRPHLILTSSSPHPHLISSQWSEFRVSGTNTRKVQKKKLQELVKKTLEAAILGSEIAHIGEDPAIWIAWDEESSIDLWRAKRGLLLELEAALKARKEDPKTNVAHVEKVASKIEKVNAKLAKVSPKDDANVPTGHVAVTVFATFENDDHCRFTSNPRVSCDGSVFSDRLLVITDDAALELGSVQMGKHRVKISQAPEPETIHWGHLQYTMREKSLRSTVIGAATVFVLALGVWGIVLVSELKESNPYTNDCRWVVGARQNDTATEICPQPRNASGPHATVYRNAYASVSEITGVDFPVITGVAELPLCEPVRAGLYVDWPDWLPSGTGAAAAANCHRVDREPASLFAGGDVDTMCYACTCAVFSADQRAALGPDYCQLYEDDKAASGIWFLVGTVIVVIVN